MNSLFQRLPVEILHIILSYDGSILKERIGKYMRQISRTDERYKIFARIPRKDILSSHNNWSYVYVHFLDDIYDLSMTEHYDIIRYMLYKNGIEMQESRFISR